MRACACDPHWMIRLLCNLSPDAGNRSTPALLVKKCRITTIVIYYFVKAVLWRGPAVFDWFCSKGKYWHGRLKMQIIAADLFGGKYRQRYLLRFTIGFKAHSVTNRTVQGGQFAPLLLRIAMVQTKYGLLPQAQQAQKWQRQRRKTKFSGSLHGWSVLRAASTTSHRVKEESNLGRHFSISE